MGSLESLTGMTSSEIPLDITLIARPPEPLLNGCASSVESFVTDAIMYLLENRNALRSFNDYLVFAIVIVPE